MDDRRFAVVGGGIVGASVAYHLAGRTDDPVTLYERGDLAAETTHWSTAMIGVAGPAPFAEMKQYGFRVYNRLLADPTTDVRYRGSGRLRVATSSAGASTLADLQAGESAEPARLGGHPETDVSNSLVGYVPGAELSGRFLLPHLDTDRVEGALHRPQYGHVVSDTRTLGARDLALEFVERARDEGVAVETNTAVTDVRTADGRVTGIETDGTDLRDADCVVCAAGPWNARLARRAGLEVPLEHVFSPVFSLALDEPLSSTMPTIKHHESSVGLHHKRDDRVLVTYAGSGDRERYDPDAVSGRPTADHRGTALSHAERLLPVLSEAELADEWVGLGTNTPDGRPVVGPTAVEGLSLAATMSGIQYAPAVGSIVARQLVDGDPTEYYDAVSISRFEGHTDRWPGDRSP